MMTDTVQVIWKHEDGAMPSRVQAVVDEARTELLLRTLQLPEELADTIRYNSEKSKQTVPEYLSSILIKQLKTA